MPSSVVSATHLGLFVRSLVGLDREAATAAFEDFLAGRALGGNQLHFVNLVIGGLTERSHGAGTDRNKVWLMQASAGHPGATVAKGQRSSRNR